MLPRSLTVGLLLLLASPASAQSIYRWVDAEGVTHYTDEPASVPKGIAIVATDGEAISEMGTPPAVRPRPPGFAPPFAASRPSSTEPAVPGQSEQYWRGQFREAHDKIAALEDELAADKRVSEQLGPQFHCSYGSVGGYRGVVSGNPQGVQIQVGPVFNTGYVVPHGGCYPVVNSEWERTRIRVEKNRKALERAKEDLHELERRASFEAVPNEWRR